MLIQHAAFQDRATGNERDHVHVFGTLVEMILILALIVLFNNFPDKIGVIPSLTDPSSFKPLLAPEFQAHMPWLNVYWGLALSLCALNLALGAWNPFTRLAEIGLQALGAYILLRMITGGPLIVYSEFTLLVKFALALALLASAIDIIAKLVRWLAMQTVPEPRES
jgi:hypothetical protein